jgi:hypothetical protein
MDWLALFHNVHVVRWTKRRIAHEAVALKFLLEAGKCRRIDLSRFDTFGGAEAHKAREADPILAVRGPRPQNLPGRRLTQTDSAARHDL